MRGLPWKENSVQVGELDERTSNLFLIVSILSFKKSRKRFGRSIRGKTVGRGDGFLFPSSWTLLDLITIVSSFGFVN